MRIAVAHNLPSGGSRRQVWEHCRLLRARGHVVEMFSPATADEELLPLAAVADRVHVWPTPTPPGREASLFGVVSPSTAWRGARLLGALARIHRGMAARIDAGGFDVVLASHDMYTHAPGVLPYLRTPTAYYCAEPLRFVYEASVGMAVPPPGGSAMRTARATATALAKRVLGGIDARNMRAARVVLTNSIYSHESIMRAYGRPARVVYLGVDTVRFHPLPRERERVVLSVGAMHPLKGFDFLVSALACVPAERRPRLVLISDRGYAMYRGRLEAHAARLGVQLELHPRVSDRELLEWYNRASLVAYAPYLEPFGLVALEAMACGTPVVAIAEGGARESVRAGETGLLAPRDVREFADAIERALSDPALARRLADAALEDVRRRWTWEASTTRLEAALDDCRRPTTLEVAA